MHTNEPFALTLYTPMNPEKRLCHNGRLFTVFKETESARERKEVETASRKIALNRQGVIFTYLPTHISRLN